MTMQGGAPLRGLIAAAACGAIAGAAWSAKLPTQDFDTFLVEGYSQMAEAGPSANEARAAYFHERAGLAARGGVVLPTSPDAQALDSWTLREASFARRQLVHRLDAGAREKQPLLAAIAQVNFDCWIAPGSKKGGGPNSDECRRRFYFAFAGLTAGGSDLPPESAPTEIAGASADMTATPGADTEPSQPPATRPLIMAPPATANPTTGGSSTGVRLASANGSAPSGSETQYSPADQGSLARLIQSVLRQTKCNRNDRNCVPVSFTGPSADLLIRDLRDGGSDGNATGGAEGAAGDAQGGGGGNGGGKGNGHGNGHGKGPG